MASGPKTSPQWSALSAQSLGEAASAGSIALLPVGATEQHGPHLATGTDTLLAERIALEAARRTGDIVLPALPYGCSLGHTARWPGTLSLHPTTMIAALVEIGRWVHGSGFRKFVIVNGHATNGPPCQSALLQLRHELPDLRPAFFSIFALSGPLTARYAADAPDFHANEAETSMVMHLEPEQVLGGAIVDEPDRSEGRLLLYPMPAMTSSGVVGAPSTARSDRGAELFEGLVQALAEKLTRARSEQDPQL
jgi:creatinine amidohydrolase